MAENKDFCQEILRLIFKDKNIKVLINKTQFKLGNLYGRSLIIDLKCLLSSGITVNVEVQKSNNNDNHLRRVRYHGAILTTNITNPNTYFNAVPDVVVIYITSFDFLKGHRVIYHARTTIEETGEKLANGYQEIYVNAEIDDGSDISELMKYFVGKECTPERAKELFPKTIELKEYYTKTEKGVEIMTDLVEKLLKEEEENIRKDAAEKAKREIAAAMLQDQEPIEKIAKYSKLPLDVVTNIRASLSL